MFLPEPFHTLSTETFSTRVLSFMSFGEPDRLGTGDVGLELGFRP